MNTIRATARGMIAEEGAIAYIIDLLEDPEDARYNLKPEIKAIRETAKKCLQNAEAITSKFQYWHLVICHLKQTSLTKRGTSYKYIWLPTSPARDVGAVFLIKRSYDST
jgi:hypothetical protein